jgi:hypothetical protein
MSSLTPHGLTGTQADFIFFMTIAAICFSGLLFTLWELAQQEHKNTWTVKSIAWLMTQVWFGMNAHLMPSMYFNSSSV